MSGSVSSEGCNHQRRLRIPQTSLYSSPRFSSNTLGLPDPLWNPFVKSSPRLGTQSQAYTTTYVALLIYVELTRCGRCWYRSYTKKFRTTPPQQRDTTMASPDGGAPTVEAHIRRSEHDYLSASRPFPTAVVQATAPSWGRHGVAGNRPRSYSRR